MSECECPVCRKCCWRSCGFFGSIEEIEGAAAIKNMAIKDFVTEYLIREWYTDECTEIPAPRKDFARPTTDAVTEDGEIESNGKGFVRASWFHNLMTGYACVFLDDDEKCSIHSSKPHECRETSCHTRVNHREPIQLYWRDNQDWIEQFIPRDSHD